GRVFLVVSVFRLPTPSQAGSLLKSKCFPLTVTSEIHASPALSQDLNTGSKPKCVKVAPSVKCSFDTVQELDCSFKTSVNTPVPAASLGSYRKRQLYILSSGMRVLSNSGPGATSLMSEAPARQRLVQYSRWERKPSPRPLKRAANVLGVRH